MSEINTQTDGTVRIRKAGPDQTNKQKQTSKQTRMQKKIDTYSLQAQKCEVRIPLTTGPFPIVLSYKRALSLTYSFQPAQKKSMQRPLIHLLLKSIFT